jgi:hypothetical protein
MVTSVSAVVLSIISATSCAFVSFDHQYKASATAEGGRRMLMLQVLKERVVGGLNLRRRAQNGAFGGGENASLPSSGAGDGESSLLDNNGDPFLMEPGIQLTEPSPTTAAVDTMAETFTEPTVTTSASAPSNGASAGGDAMAETVTEPSDTMTSPSNGPNSDVGDSKAETVTEPSDTMASPSNGPNSVGGDSMAETVPADGSGDALGEDLNFGPGGTGDPMAGTNSGGSSSPQISGGGTYGSSASASGGASAIVKGDAGLFCDTDPSFSYTSLWNGGSVKAFEAEIASGSDNNKSEEAARNGALAATIVGAFMATILTIECLLGKQMCLEKWFIGIMAIIACVSQGITFAFFNSQRYCDGDILHEILNQEPCVLGKGAIMSVVALLFYFFILLLVCKVPKDDPYGLCCKSKKAGGSDKVFHGADGNSGFLMGSNPSNSKPERPTWISDDKRGEEEEENKIV